MTTANSRDDEGAAAGEGGADNGVLGPINLAQRASHIPQ